MSKVVLYNPAISSMNLGDHVIAEAARRHLDPVLEDAFIVEISTHLPVSRFMRHLSDARLRFVLGTNLLRGKMNRRFRQWDFHIFNARQVRPAILMGAGWWQYEDGPNKYTALLYRRTLSQRYQHSVRDQYTATRLREMGVSNVVVTACPSMWDLTQEHCRSIPSGKGTDVVTTLTDYHPSPSEDRQLLRLLLSSYNQVSYWVQGYSDLEYLHSLGDVAREVRVIPPSLAAFDRTLVTGNADYVGTRLHGGIRAMQRGVRSLIVGVDNRALEKHRDFGLPCVRRQDIGSLRERLDAHWSTELKLPWGEIQSWKAQFNSTE